MSRMAFIFVLTVVHRCKHLVAFHSNPLLATPMGNSARPTKRASKQADPYQAQIKQLKLEIRQLKLDLKQITSKMSNIRSGYNETSAFVPGGLFSIA